MKANTKDLTGKALDYAVALCEDKTCALHDDGITSCIIVVSPSGVYKAKYQPSINWDIAGPIIERESIGVWFEEPAKVWISNKPTWNGETFKQSLEYGNSPLIAVMRCYVASNLGDVIELPDELFN